MTQTMMQEVAAWIMHCPIPHLNIFAKIQMGKQRWMDKSFHLMRQKYRKHEDIAITDMRSIVPQIHLNQRARVSQL